MQGTFLIKTVEEPRTYETRYGDKGKVQGVLISWDDQIPAKDGTMANRPQFIKAKMFNDTVEQFKAQGLEVGKWMTCHLKFDIQGKYDNNEVIIINPEAYKEQ